MSGCIDIAQKLCRCVSGRIGPRQQQRGIDVALHGAFRITALQLAEIQAPVGCQHLGRQPRVRIDEVRRVLEKQDPRHAGVADAFQQGAQMRLDQALPVVE